MQELMKKGFPDISASLSETEIASVAGSLKLVRSQIDRNDSLTFSDILQNSVGSNKDGENISIIYTNNGEIIIKAYFSENRPYVKLRDFLIKMQ